MVLENKLNILNQVELNQTEERIRPYTVSFLK
jgi:hypothetical protein